MNIGQIFTADSANGIGIRVAVFVSGCLNHCPGCFQPETWDFHYGSKYTEEVEQTILEELKKPYYDGLTILGGDPMEEQNQPEVADLILRVNRELPERTIWMYTGYIYESDLLPGGRRYYSSVTDQILDGIDVLVDGPFVEAKKNLTLNFRGSWNQRIIDMKRTRWTGIVTLHSLNDDIGNFGHGSPFGGGGSK